MALEPESDLWAQIRYAYEDTDQPIGDICVEHGISSGTLRDRMRRWRWKRRRPPIPQAGPPPVAAMQRDPPPPREGEGAAAMDESRSDFQSRPDHPAPLICADTQPAGPLFAKEGAETDAAAIVPRLRSAIACVLAAIEATNARLAAGSHSPREIGQAGRTLGALTRTLRELNALLNEHIARAASEPKPVDLDELRNELARRIHALIDAGPEEEAKAEET